MQKLAFIFSHFIDTDYVELVVFDNKNVEMSFELALQLSEGREVKMLCWVTGRYSVCIYTRSQLLPLKSREHYS